MDMTKKWCMDEMIRELDKLYDNGEIDDEEFEERMREWEDGYDRSQEELWELRTDR